MLRLRGIESENYFIYIKRDLKNVPYEIILRQKASLDVRCIPTKKKGIQKKEKERLKYKGEKNSAVYRNIHYRKRRRAIIFPKGKANPIDPRFESFAGKLDSTLAAKSYAFIPQMQQREMSYLKKALKNKKLPYDYRYVLTSNYSQITNAYRRAENNQLYQRTKKYLTVGGHYPKPKYLKQQIYYNRLNLLRPADRDKKRKYKEARKIKTYYIYRRKMFAKS